MRGKPEAESDLQISEPDDTEHISAMGCEICNLWFFADGVTLPFSESRGGALVPTFCGRLEMFIDDVVDTKKACHTCLQKDSELFEKHYKASHA